MTAAKKPVLVPIKDEDREKHGLPEEGELKQRDIVKAQDDTKKKNFHRYFRWKFSLYNDNNLKSPSETSLLMQHDEEYRACYIK